MLSTVFFFKYFIDVDFDELSKSKSVSFTRILRNIIKDLKIDF